MGFLLMGGSASNGRGNAEKCWTVLFHSAIPIHFTLTNKWIMVFADWVRGFCVSECMRERKSSWKLFQLIYPLRWHTKIKMPPSSGGLLSSISGTSNPPLLFCEMNLKFRHEIDMFSDQRPESEPNYNENRYAVPCKIKDTSYNNKSCGSLSIEGERAPPLWIFHLILFSYFSECIFDWA